MRCILAGLLKFKLNGLLLCAACAAFVMRGRPVLADTINYAYDALGRLKSATDVSNSSSITYNYDAAGNRTSMVVVPAVGTTVVASSSVTSYQFHGTRAQYSIVSNAFGGVTITDQVSGRDGVVNVNGVSSLQPAPVFTLGFTDKSILVLNQDGASIDRLYQAILHRQPAPSEIDFYYPVYEQAVPAADRANPSAGLMDSIYGGNSLVQDFISSPEYANLYPLTNGVPSAAQFITDSYNFALGRLPSAVELAYQENLLAPTNGGAVYSRAQVIDFIINSPECINYTESSNGFIALLN